MRKAEHGSGTRGRPGDAEHPGERPSKRYLGIPLEVWTVIGVIATVVGVIAALVPHHGSGSSGATGGSTAPTSTVKPTIHPSTITPTGSGQWPDRQWGPGTVLMNDLVNVDLDSVPPNVNGVSGSATDTILQNDALQDTAGGIAPWTGTSAPTAAACAALISTQGVGSVKPVPEHAICLKTGQGNIAILMVKHVDLDSSDDITDVTVQATVWSRSSPAPSSLGQWPDKQWGPGTVLMNDLVNVDLDSVPPNVNGVSGSATDTILQNDALQDTAGGIAPWTGTSAPTAAACAALISTQGVGSVKPVPEHAICLKTGQGNIAILMVKHVDLDSSDDITDVTVQATVWAMGQ